MPTLMLGLGLLTFSVAFHIIALELIIPRVPLRLRILFWAIKFPAILVLNGINILVLVINRSGPATWIAIAYTAGSIASGIALATAFREDSKLRTFVLNIMLVCVPVISFQIVWILGIALEQVFAI